MTERLKYVVQFFDAKTGWTDLGTCPNPHTAIAMVAEFRAKSPRRYRIVGRSMA